MGRPSLAQLQEQVQQLKEEEGIVDQPEKIVLQDAAAVKHKLDHTAAEASQYQAYGVHDGQGVVHFSRHAACCGQANSVWGSLTRCGVTCGCVAKVCGCCSPVCLRVQVILKSGYEEDHLISNVKIALGAIG